MPMSIEEIEKLKKILEEREQEILDQYQCQKVLGFTLSKCSTKAHNGKRYVVWRAHICQNNYKVLIHIGVDPRKAADKIRAYLSSHPDVAKNLRLRGRKPKKI